MRGSVSGSIIVVLLSCASAWGQAGGYDGPQFSSAGGVPSNTGADDSVSRLPPSDNDPPPMSPLPAAELGGWQPLPSTPPSGYGLPPQGGYGQPGQPVGPPPRPYTTLSVQIDAMGLFRSTGNSTFLGQTSLGGFGNAVDSLHANDTNFGIQPGLRAAIQMRIGDSLSYEAMYFGLQNWSASSSISADPIAGTLATSPYTQSDKLIGGFDSTLSHTYKSQLQNAEFNARRLYQTGPWTLSPLVGFRYFQWTESMSLTGTDRFYGLTEILTATPTTIWWVCKSAATCGAIGTASA